MQNSKSIYDIYDNTMETRTVQSDQITTTTIGLTTRTEGGSSSADETCVTKKKAKKRDRSPNTDNEAVMPASPTPQVQATNPGVVQQKKEKQRPETWNKLEQQIFFNALRQNGKNFESITQYFNARQKRFKVDDGVYVQRSKEQIRHFYYRTWHKIIKYILIPLPKNKNSNTPAGAGTAPSTSSTAHNGSSQANTLNVDCSVVSLRDIQVKCLIAFNVLMTKLHRWNKKSALKLVELINQGWTTIREKGKVTRLKMPICKDSTKTVQSDPETTANDEVKGTIPYSINIQLEPKNESAYCRVHRLAQTPFLNIEIQTLQTVRYLIEYLENKWKNRRNQFLEKFKISEPRTFVNIETNNEENEDCQKKTTANNNDSLSNTSTNYFLENLTLFPNESIHKLNDIDLNDHLENNKNDNNMEVGIKLKSVLNDDQGISSPKQQTKALGNRTNVIQQNLLMNDETMMIDDFALIAAKNQMNSEAKETLAAENNNRCSNNTILFADQLRAGLTASNLKIVPDGNLCKDFKDLTFAQLYLALDKPEKISFKYDWISASSTKQLSNVAEMGLKRIGSNSSHSSISPSFGSFDFSKIQRQRFYIETLASVASSFLNSIQMTKNSSLQSNNQDLSSNQSDNKPNGKTKADVNQKAANSTGQIRQSNTQSKSPQKAPLATILQPPSTTSQMISLGQEVVTAATTTAPLPTIDAALVRLISQEQNSKTQKLLSDLNSKKRSRQRKQIMVVGNVGVNKHSPLPKLSLNMDFNQLSCQLNISPQSSNNSNSTNEAFANATQNIVYSGPVAAVARQIVNNSSLLTLTPTTSINSPQSTESLINQQAITNAASNSIDQGVANSHNQNHNNDHNLMDQNSQSISSFQHALSAFMPNFLSSLTDNSSSNEENDIRYEDNLNQQHQQPESIVNGPTDTLTDMSLLDLSINNADSLFGPSTNINDSNRNMNSQNNHHDNNVHDNNINMNGMIQQNKNSQITKFNTSNNTNNNNSMLVGAFSSVNNSKQQEKDNISQIAQDISLMTSSSAFTSSIKSTNADNNHVNPTSGHSLVHKKSDVCEWTESMADVSLTGILTDIVQSPIKQSNSINLATYNDNSNNSIYITMDTIMEIMPTSSSRYEPDTTNRFDENSLISCLTSNDRISTNLQN